METPVGTIGTELLVGVDRGQRERYRLVKRYQRRTQVNVPDVGCIDIPSLFREIHQLAINTQHGNRGNATENAGLDKFSCLKASHINREVQITHNHMPKSSHNESRRSPGLQPHKTSHTPASSPGRQSPALLASHCRTAIRQRQPSFWARNAGVVNCL